MSTASAPEIRPVSVVLPWPPSVNRIWRSVAIRGAVRVLVSREGREYRRAVLRALRGCRQAAGVCFRGPVAVRIAAYPPDARRRDLDNVIKAALDALTHSGLWDDDHRVADLHIWRMVPARAAAEARLEVTVEPRVPLWVGKA